MAETVWPGQVIDWKAPATWYEPLSLWLKPHLSRRSFARLSALGEQDLCWDDWDWREKILAPELTEDFADVVSALGEALSHSTARVYHGCRVDDAGVFHRDGLKVNDPAELEALARRIVAEEEDFAWMRNGWLDKQLAEHPRDRDTGWLYAGLDDRELCDGAGHYALYGPEWLQALFSFSGFRVLRSRGVPTIVQLDLPLSLTSDGIRRELAEALLQEWVRITVNRPEWTPQINFSISLKHALDRSIVVGHYHPAALTCPYYGKETVKTAVTVCPSCVAVVDEGL